MTTQVMENQWLHRDTVRLDSEEYVCLQEDVEDTKAGKYERGRLKVTTLRVIWTSSHHATVNLCIGLQTINKLDVSNKLRSGRTPSTWF